MEIDLMLKILGTKATQLDASKDQVACETCTPYVGFESSVSA